ncbi:hypothetical protein [Flavobacterium glaciei]|uniref:C1q domain-containing protein n=1 Tax=Flavobacterium glaciei TaxID=386300 RepID=A0A562Q226_9FLAO|nr:hypothetical protein [Flavobacterium glaciei]RDI57469.1 hypothetical protein DFR66_10283 [Flavobacterium glaciei]TWI50729.1 hypothetical protein IQ02_00633 [Flavobacterium glaciei]
MKPFLTLLVLACFASAFAQVGIGTTNPTSTLDVNGDLRIRSTNTTFTDSAPKDSIIVVNNLGVLQRTNSKSIVNSYLKTIVKGVFSSASLVDLNLLAGTIKIPFNLVEFDSNAEFDTNTNTFTAKENGIYALNVQIKADATLGVTTNFGVAILKNGVVIARNSFANVGVTIAFVETKVSSPLRSLQSLIQLNSNDTITFNVVSDLANVKLLGTKEDCFFSIQQVR